MKTFLLIIITLFALGVKAQTSVYHPFPESDAVWTISHGVGLLECNGNPMSESYSYTFSGDTVLNSVTYHKLSIPSVQKSGTCNYWFSSPGYAGCIRQDIPAKKVFFVSPGNTSEELLYDFNMQVGDTVKGYIEDGAADKDIIISMDSVLVGGSYRKQWGNSCLNIIEGIGSTSGFNWQSPGCGNEYVSFGDGNVYSTTCFQQNGQTLFPHVPSNCSTIASLKPIDKNSTQFNVFPNPSNGSFALEIDKAAVKEIRLTDMLGNLIYIRRSDFQPKINIDNLSSGTFILSVVDKENYTTNRKIVSCP